MGAEREWWERLSLGEEFDRLEESLDYRRIRMHSRDGKILWDIAKKSPSQ